MIAYLLVSSGDGPGECELAVSHVLGRMVQDADRSGLDISMKENQGRHGTISAIVVLGGEGADAFARGWTGTIKWVCKSPLRPHHKRRNWFVGVHALQRPETAPQFDPRDVKWTTMRAGGAGGQHQNTTDSAVRAVHVPSGLTVVVRSERSQHRNKAEALVRLQDMLALSEQTSAAAMRRSENLLHHSLERGNPIRVFNGERFQEAR